MTTTMTATEIRVTARDIPATDGYPLAATIYDGATGQAPRVAIMNGAMGVRHERYDGFARYLSAKGWIVVTYDYRGIGGSRHGSLKGSPARLMEWGEKDLAGVIDFVYREFAPERCVAIGHSIGGQILALAPNHEKLDAALLIASQKGYTKYWDGIWRSMVTALWYALPVLVKLFGRLPMGMGGCEDLPPRVALDWQRWAMVPDFVDENWESLDGKFRGFTSPMLSISFSDDQMYAPFRAVEALLDLYPSAPSQHWHFRPNDVGAKSVGHSGFFNAGTCPELWESTNQWLQTARSPFNR